MKDKKVLIVSIVSVILLVGVTVGISLAFFNYARTGTTDNTIETGNITFLYTETSSVGRGIAIEDAFPISNNEGKLLTGEGNVFDFNISSTTQSNTNIPYEITARKKDDSTLSEDVVVMYLTKVNGTNEQEVLLDKYSNLTQTDKTNAYTEKVLYRDAVYSDSNYNQDYRLRMWITNDGTFTSDDMGKTFTVIVNVYSNGTVVTEAQKSLENNNNVTSVSVNNNELTKIENKTYDYEAKLEEGTTSVTLNIETESPNAKVNVEKLNNLAKSNSITKLSTQITLDNLTNGSNLYKIIVLSPNEKVIDEYILKLVVGNSCKYAIGEVWNFAYTGGEQKFTIPCDGTYKLETWGAQGGSYNETYHGGYGAYAVGNINLEFDDNLFINVGGAGVSGSTSQAGGYNGGGRYVYNNDNRYGASGGGATHIATTSGLLSTLSEKQDNLLIVSGGGGGATYQANDTCGDGGNAGGILGNSAVPSAACLYTSSYLRYGSGGSQTLGGKGKNIVDKNYEGDFGVGAPTYDTYVRYHASGAGAGYYGGGSEECGGPAGGGSSYIGNNLLTDKAMYCYSCEESNDIGTKTISVNNVSNDPISNYAKLGNGYARITLVSLN